MYSYVFENANYLKPRSGEDRPLPPSFGVVSGFVRGAKKIIFIFYA
jgi:hypothetical protein